jgi:hypothetical protein
MTPFPAVICTNRIFEASEKFLDRQNFGISPDSPSRNVQTADAGVLTPALHSGGGDQAYCFGVADGAGVAAGTGLVGNACGVTGPVGIPGSKLAGCAVLIIAKASPLKSRPSRSSVGGLIPGRF